MPIPNAWWGYFEDETLNALVEQVLADNFSLQSVKAQVERSAMLALRGTPGLPASASAGMSYGLDLGGNLTSLPLAASSPVVANLAELSAFASTLSVNVTTTYFSLSKSRAELRLLDRQTATSRQLLKLVESAQEEGRASPDEVLRQRLWVASADSQRIQAQARQQRLTHQLAVLVGKPVSQFELPATASTLQPLPPLPADDLPVDWLQHRPDIQTAFLRIRSTDTETAEAIASGLPSLDLYSILTKAAISPTELVRGLLVGLASRHSAPLLGKFDAYLDVSLEVNLDEAEQAQAHADFRQKMLMAVQEVEDALVTERHDRVLLSSLSERLYLARWAFHQLSQRYAEGDAGFFEVYTALQNVQALEHQHLSTRLALMLDRVTVARAMAGSWAHPHTAPQKLLRSTSPFYQDDARAGSARGATAVQG